MAPYWCHIKGMKTPRRTAPAGTIKGTKTPAYRLLEFHLSLNRRHLFAITFKARDEALALGLADEASIRSALSGLDPMDFFKSMESDKRPGAWQDVYHLPFGGRTLYVKFMRDPKGIFVLTSCKEK